MKFMQNDIHIVSILFNLNKAINEIEMIKRSTFNWKWLMCICEEFKRTKRANQTKWNINHLD